MILGSCGRGSSGTNEAVRRRVLRAPTRSGSGEKDEDTFSEGDSEEVGVLVLVLVEVRSMGDAGCCAALAVVPDE